MGLERLRKLLEAVTQEQEDILNDAVGENGDARALNDTEQSEYDRLDKKADELLEMIKRAEKVKKSRDKVNDLNEPANQNRSPDITVIREHNCDENGEYRGFVSLGDQLQSIARAAINPHKVDERLIENQRAASGANEDVGAEGGFAVQSDFAQMLFSNVVDAGVIAPLCRQIPTSKNSILMTLLEETDLSIGSQFGGARAYWRAEAGTVTAKKPAYRQERVEAEALEALYYATDELLEDAPALQSFVEQAFRTVMAFQLDDAIIRGDGAGKPLGILNAPALKSIAKETSQTADTVNFENVNKMENAILDKSVDSAIWLAHRTCFPLLRKMVLAGTSSDVPVWLPAGAYGNPEQTLFGRPLKRCSQLNPVGDLGDILYVDPKYYLLLKKTGIKASESSHVAFLTGEKVFKWTLRVNGMPLINSAITDANGTGTTSPFVALAERA